MGASSIGRSSSGPSAATLLTAMPTGHMRKAGRRRRTKQRLDVAQVGLRVQPDVERVPIQDHRHPVVDRCQQLVRCGGHDRRRRGFAVDRAPDAGQRQHLPVGCGTDGVRLPRRRGAIPLVEGVRRDDAAALAQRAAERRRVPGRLGTGVDPGLGRPLCLVIGPEGPKAPARRCQPPLILALDDHPDRLGGRHVEEAVGQVLVGIRAEVVADPVGGLALAESAAHVARMVAAARGLAPGCT